MKPIVLYTTKSGNTEKVAKAIACELRCPYTKISSASKSSTLNLDDYDMMFVGTGIYRGKPHADLQDFLSEMQMKTRKPFALFMTWFGWGKGIADKNVIETVKALVETKRQTMLSSQYICLGEGLVLVKCGHPDNSELNDAKKWARELIVGQSAAR